MSRGHVAQIIEDEIESADNIAQLRRKLARKGDYVMSSQLATWKRSRKIPANYVEYFRRATGGKYSRFELAPETFWFELDTVA